MSAVRLLVCATFSLTCCSLDEPELLRALELTPEPAPLIGEGVSEAQPCEWPTAVLLGAGGCSGVLIHPQVVMTAAHCIGGSGPAEIRFGEQGGTPARIVATSSCERNPAANGSVNGEDYAYCVLAEPVDLALAPPLLGCEVEWLEVGQPFVTVGWGNGEGGGGIKRLAASEFIGWNADMIAASPDPAELCSGDSGGPTYVQLPDGSWRLVGVSSGGPVGQNPGCIDPVLIVPAQNAIAWIEQQTGIDVSPCHLADGTWSAGPACTGFALDPELGGAWMDGGCPDELSGPAKTCGPSFEQAEESNAPIVTITAPADGSQFPGSSAVVDIEISAEDADGVAVLGVELSIDGSVVASESIEDPIDEPASWVFAGAEFPVGEYTLSATATDYWGNVGMSNSVTIVVGDRPSDDESSSGDSSGDTTETDEGETTDAGMDEVGESDESGVAADAGGDDSQGCACTSEDRQGGLPLLGLLALLGLHCGRGRGLGSSRKSTRA